MVCSVAWIMTHLILWLLLRSSCDESIMLCFNKRRCFGTKSQGKNGRDMGTGIQNFSTLWTTRRKKNCVHGLFLSTGEFCTDDVILQEEALCYFKSLFYSSEASESTNLGLYNLPTLSNEGVDCLLKPVIKIKSL